MNQNKNNKIMQTMINEKPYSLEELSLIWIPYRESPYLSLKTANMTNKNWKKHEKGKDSNWIIRMEIKIREKLTNCRLIE